MVLKYVYTAAIGALTYAVVWLTRGSGWSRAEIASGVALAVTLGLIASRFWHRYRHPALEPPSADAHRPEQWSVLRRK
jgi:hypothetical protein